MRKIDFFIEVLFKMPFDPCQPCQPRRPPMTQAELDAHHVCRQISPDAMRRVREILGTAQSDDQTIYTIPENEVS